MGVPQSGSFPLRAILEIADIGRLEPLAGYQEQLLDVISARWAQGDDVLTVTAAIADANNLLTQTLLGLPPRNDRSTAGGPPRRS